MSVTTLLFGRSMPSLGTLIIFGFFGMFCAAALVIAGIAYLI